MRALLLYNPTATTTTTGLTDLITRALSSALTVEAVPTKRRNHAGFLASGAADEGFDVVVVLGGDGTVNEVVQGIATTDVALAVIPGGSTNVLARSLGLPNEPVAATGVIVRRLGEGGIRRINLGLANDRYFTFNAGFGFDAEVVRQVERRYHLKKTVRQASYVWCATMAYLTEPRVRRARITVTGGDGRRLERQRWVVACNASPYTYVGPRPVDLCPPADVGRDLALFAASRTGPAAMARIARVALTSSSIASLRTVEVLADQPRVRCEADRPLPLQLDGDYVGDTTSVEFSTVHGALAIVA